MFNFDALAPKNRAYLEAFIPKVMAYEAVVDDYFVQTFQEGTGDDLIVCLPGSFIWASYMTDFVNGLMQHAPNSRIIAINYPTRRHEYTPTQRDAFDLADYVGWVMAYLRQIAHGKRLILVGHSLGTIVLQLLSLTILYAKTERIPLDLTLSACVVLGGGPPKLGWRDMLASLARPTTLGVVMGMVQNPEKFAHGNIAKTLADPSRFETLDGQKAIFVESKRVMQESFLEGNYAYIPAPLFDQQGVKRLILGGSADLFLTTGSLNRAFAQWGGDHRMLPLEHTDLVMGETGYGVGVQVGQWLEQALRVH